MNLFIERNKKELQLVLTLLIFGLLCVCAYYKDEWFQNIETITYSTGCNETFINGKNVTKLCVNERLAIEQNSGFGKRPVNLSGWNLSALEKHDIVFVNASMPSNLTDVNLSNIEQQGIVFVNASNNVTQDNKDSIVVFNGTEAPSIGNVTISNATN